MTKNRLALALYVPSQWQKNNRDSSKIIVDKWQTEAVRMLWAPVVSLILCSPCFFFFSALSWEDGCFGPALSICLFYIKVGWDLSKLIFFLGNTHSKTHTHSHCLIVTVCSCCPWSLKCSFKGYLEPTLMFCHYFLHSDTTIRKYTADSQK